MMENKGNAMTEEQKKEYADAVIRLCAHAVRGETPDEGFVRGLDLELLYRAARRHLLTGIVAYALESAGVFDKNFTQAKGKAIRKVAAMDVEMTGIFEEFDRRGIWHAPLKGSVLKDLYPEVGMRQMSDHDILIDADRAEEAKRIMEERGFETVSFGMGVHDSYHKKPVCNFELHRALFSPAFNERIAAYYENVKERLIPDRDGSLGYHFSLEDFYLYVTAHECKHYSGNGTGLRSLLDTYVYLRQFEKTLDWVYVSAEAEKLGITDFERLSRNLSRKLFDGKKLTGEEEEMLEYVLGSGTYGTLENGVKRKLKEKGRLRYLLGQAFPNLEHMKMSVSFVDGFPFLYPLGIVWRWGRILLFRRPYLRRVLRVVFKK